jgi:hypothetical protein
MLSATLYGAHEFGGMISGRSVELVPGRRAMKAMELDTTR